MLQINKHNDISEIALDNPPANAMDAAFMAAIRAALAEVQSAGAKAIVISGRPGMYSGGVDVPGLLQADRETVLNFWVEFLTLMREVAAAEVPVIAAITGHAPAGGCVLALHCDYRIAGAGKFKFGLNEVQVGLPVPSTVLAAMEFVAGPRTAQKLSMQGALLSPEAALACGLVDEVVDPDEVIPRSVEFAQQLAQLPPVAMNVTRRQAKAAFVAGLTIHDDARATTDFWFSDETRAAMQALVERLKK